MSFRACVLAFAASVALSMSSAAGQDGMPSEESLRQALKTLEALSTGPPPGPRTRSSAMIDAVGEASIEFLRRFVSNRVIYGADNRRNYGDPGVTAGQRLAADATAVFVDDEQPSAEGDGKFSLPQWNVGFCRPDEVPKGEHAERFYDEPTPGSCTGFKVGPDIVATAGHCVETASDCESLRLIFGFYNRGDGSTPGADIARQNIYQCAEVLDGEFDSDGSDWRLIRVDRPIDAPQVTLRSSGKPARGTHLTVIGYPVGLPVKIADGAEVRHDRGDYFVADLDTYGGNSGSPVFNSEALAHGDLLVEGILVRGEEDFVQYDPCLISNRCPIFSKCRGEDATHAATVSRALGRFVN